MKRRMGLVTVAAFAALLLVGCDGGGRAVTATPTTTTKAAQTLSPGFRESYCPINQATQKACRDYDAEAAHPKPQPQKKRGAPLMAWLLIPAALGAGWWALAPVREARAARQAEMEAQLRRDRDEDEVEDYPEDYPEDDDDFTYEDETPVAPVAAPEPTPAPPVGNLLSSLRQQQQNS
ncbi:hypothetical protein [Mycobacteroides abscessus]|jgi:hypothetical protein|uniref:Lipoprotein n=2 Tax=Mycobacteriaceae TaxID=1762 RepID=A0AB73MLA0_MYCCH|nr:hypothetical protein [Mycobacteroides abscessus]KRQ31282.1 hypothetical protein AOT86_01315 [Mycobacteroides sp. H072]KRQ35961.1 hypothetical protein AOT84_15795 [Mycobacteroides sp. H002]KRQ50501.1 hypothetical protein AOT85_13435 [Mycobacteroides sp. H054]KRQ72736.1 hypothetical protein AOT83_05085 [Mycobacteroides sp. H001]OHT55212.1 hypothetical protein BKG62_03305 [Mycobacteroides chelonae]